MGAKMANSLMTFFIALGSLCAACGCATYTSPTAASETTDPARRDFNAVWDASVRTLRRYDFKIDRQNRRQGLITTRPMTGRYLFEFWRRDAASWQDLEEGTVQTIYRVAKVTIRPAQGDRQRFAANVEVTVYRSNLPQPQITSASEAYDLFIRPGEVSRRRTPLGKEQKTHMVELGRDKQLERDIAAAIAAERSMQLTY